MANLIPVPEDILDTLRRRKLHVAVYDSVMQEYRVMSDLEWRNLRRCDGFDFARFRVVASSL